MEKLRILEREPLVANDAFKVFGKQEELQKAITRYATQQKVSFNNNVEEIILELPICARAPLLALYFIKIYGHKTPAPFELLLRLYQIAVRIYERHVLYGLFDGGVGKERFASSKNKALMVALDKMIQRADEDAEVVSSPFYKEVAFDLRQKLPSFYVNEQVRNSFVLEVMRIVAFYAIDVACLANFKRKDHASPLEEQIYKFKWRHFSLLKLASCQMFGVSLPTDDEYVDFFENYSLR